MRFCFALRAAERTPAKLAPPLRASTAVVRARGPFPFLRADVGVALTDLIFRGAIWGCQPALSRYFWLQNMYLAVHIR